MRIAARTLKRAVAALTAAALFVPAQHAVHAAGTTLLRYHFVAGQRFSEADTETSSTTFKVTPDIGINGTSVEVDRYTRVTVVTKVFPDGSALLRITYKNVSVTKDGTTTTYPLKGFALEIHQATTGEYLSKKTIGNDPSLSKLPSGITDPTPTTYPKAAIGVGGTWDQKQGDATLGTMVLHYTVLGFGSAQGRPTVTLKASVHQPFHFLQNGVTFSGSYSGSGTATAFVDTGAVASPTHVPLTIDGKISGTVNGVKLHGTWKVTGSLDSAPA